jgi:hypothetical protein
MVDAITHDRRSQLRRADGATGRIAAPGGPPRPGWHRGGSRVRPARSLANRNGVIRGFCARGPEFPEWSKKLDSRPHIWGRIGDIMMNGDTALERAKLALRLHPERSDRAIAKDARVSDKTVAKARARSTAENSAVGAEKRVGADGKARRQPAKVDAPAAVAPAVQPADKLSRLQSPHDVLIEISNDADAPPTARVAAARALLAHLPPGPEAVVAEDDAITPRALQIAAERNRSIN